MRDLDRLLLLRADEQANDPRVFHEAPNVLTSCRPCSICGGPRRLGKAGDVCAACRKGNRPRATSQLKQTA